jgi:hypothetical protein
LRPRHRRVVGGHSAAVILVQPFGDGRHDLVRTKLRRIVLKLFLKVSRIETGQAWNAHSIPGPVEAVAGEAGLLGAAVRAAEGDQFAGGFERVARIRRGRAAARLQSDDREAEQDRAHPGATPAEPAGSSLPEP